MGLIDDKKNVFTTIGAYVSLRDEQDLPDLTNLFPSINNKDDIGAFLIDTLKIVVGSTALQDLTGKLFTDFIDDVEPTLKDAIKKQLINFNAGSGLTQTFFTSGISVDASDIDVFGKLKTSPISDVGDLLYGVTENFDTKAYEAILNAGTDITYKNLLINYNSTLDKFTFKPVNTSTTVGDWFTSFIDDTAIINKKEFLTNVMNAVYGSVTANQDKSLEQVLNEEKIKKLIEQVTNGDDSFEISQSVEQELYDKAQELIDGVVYYDVGCGIFGANLPFSGMTSFINDVSGLTDSFRMGNRIASTIEESTENIQATADENKETIRDGFFQRIIDFLKRELGIILTSTPQIRAILAIKSAIENNGIPEIGNPIDDLKRFSVYIKCVIQEALAALFEFIFNLIIGFLISLLSPVIEKVVREKINSYIGIIKSLINQKI